MNALQIQTQARELGRSGEQAANPFPAGSTKARLWAQSYKRGQDDAKSGTEAPAVVWTPETGWQ